MALVNMNKMLADARENRYAVGNFDVLNGQMMRGVIEAAEQEKAPVILAYAEVFEPILPMEEFAPMMRAAAQRAGVPVVIHLDHARSEAYIKRAVDNGFTSVMLDASDLPFEQNVAATRRVVELCKPLQISVESELGHVGGLEGYSYEGSAEELEDGYTVVAKAVEFVKETNVDALAVAVGTVHGVYKSEPKLSIVRLKELKEALDVPLVLHGGSGLSDEDFKNVIQYGVTKTNIFTDLTLRAMQVTGEVLAGDYLSMCVAVIQAVREEAAKKIRLFGCNGKI